MAESNDLLRFETDLEFLQSLANPQYLNFLGQSKFFEDEAFMNYLNYLEYFRQREYSKFITYPTCLHVLTLLKQREFRDAIMRADVAKLLGDEIFDHFTKSKDSTELTEVNGDTTAA